MKKLGRISIIILKPGRLNNLREFNWLSFLNKNSKIAVHCKTEEANDFCKQMDHYGLRWNSGVSYLKYNYYKCYGTRTCYTNQRDFGSLEYFEENNYRILEWSDYMQIIPKDILKPGYLVVLRNGQYYIYLPYAKGYAFCKKFFDTQNLENYDCELKSKENNCFDVMKIYGYANMVLDILVEAPRERPLLWERKEHPEIKMTVDEMKQKLEEILNAKIVEE